MLTKPVTLASGETAANYVVTDGNGVRIDVLAVTRDPFDTTVVYIDTSLQVAGTQYTVTLSNLIGVDGSALSSSANTASWTGPSNVDKTAPTFSAVYASAANKIEVTFSEALDLISAQTNTNYNIYTDNICTAGVIAVSAAPAPVRNSTNFAKVQLTTASNLTAGTQYYVRANGVKDQWGNATANLCSSVFVGFAAPAAPKIASAVSQSTTSVLLTFDQSMSITGGSLTQLQTRTNYTFTGCSGANITTTGATTATATSSTQVLLANLSVAGVTAGPCKVTLANPGSAIVGTTGVVLSTTGNVAFFNYSTSDTSGPFVTSVTATNSNTVRVTFNEPIANPSASSFSFSPSLTIGAFNCAATAALGYCDIPTTTDQATQSYALTVSGVTDVATNPMTSSTTTFTGDGKPYIIAIIPIDATTVRVQWSEPITSAGVQASDYTIAGATVAGAAIYTTSPSDMVELTVTGMTGGNTYTIAFADTSTATVDTTGNTVATPAVANGTFIASSASKLPLISGASSPSPTVYRITFDEALDNSTITVGNFTLATDTGSCPVTKNSISQVAAGVVQLSVTAVAGSGTCHVTVSNVKDIYGNTITAASASPVFSYTGTAGDTTAPTITSIAPASNTQIIVNFSEAVSTTGGSGGANSATNPNNYSFSPSLTGYPTGTTISCTDSVCTITLPAPGTSATSYTVTASGISDGTNIAASLSATFNGIGSSSARPSVYSATLINPTTVEVNFTEAVDLVTSQVPGAYAVTGGNSVTAAVRQGDATKVQITLLPGAFGSSTTFVVTAAGTITDVAGNFITSPLAASFNGSGNAPGTAPDLIAASDSGASNTDNTTGGSPVAFPSPGLQFTGTVAANTVVTIYDGGVAAGSAISNASGFYTVTVATAPSQVSPTGDGHDYTVRTVSASGVVSDPSPLLTVTYDGQAPSQPTSGPIMAAASDTGTLNTDAVTKNTTVTLTPGNGSGTVTANATINFYNGATLLGTTTAAGDGSYSINLNLSAIANTGNVTITTKEQDIAGNESIASAGLVVNIDTVAPTNQDTVFAASSSRTGGGSVTIVSSGAASNEVWFAPSGTTVFTAGATMTKAASGTATSILAPATAGTYKLFVLDLAGNISSESAATLTVDNVAPATPSAPVFASADDTGISTSDGVTSQTTNLTFSGTVEANARVDIYDGGPSIGNVFADALGNYTIDISLTAGVHSITVRAQDAAGNQSAASAATAVTVDTTAPTVTTGAGNGVSSSLADGNYGQGQVVPITVKFSEAVTVTGTPTLTITRITPATTAAASYVSGSGTNTLTFNYTVAVADNNADLDYAATNSLAFNGGTITDAAGNSATLTLPAVGGAGSLGGNKNLNINGVITGAISYNMAGNTTGPFKAGTLTITATYAADPGSIPTIAINQPGSTDISATAMSQISATVYTYSYTVNTATGGTYIDGSTTITLSTASSNNTFTIDTTADAAPTSLAMTTGTDTGTFNNDAVSKNSTPSFTVNCVTNSVVQLYDNAVATGSSVTCSGGTATLTPGAALTDATHPMTARQTDPAGNQSSASTTLNAIIDTAAPTNQDTVYAASSSKTGGGTVTLVSSGTASNEVWLAPSGTTTFAAGATMTKAASGTATSILAPATAGTYKLFVIDLAGNISSESAATLTVENTLPIISSVSTIDYNGNGKIDAYMITLSENVSDSSFPGYALNSLGTATANWVVGGGTYGNVKLWHGNQVSTDTAGAITDTANDNIIFIRFDELAAACSGVSQAGCDTGVKPELTTTVTPGLTDLAGNIIAQLSNPTVTEADGAKPRIATATAPGNTSVRIIFTESVIASTAECGTGSSQTGINCNTRYAITGGSGLTITSAIMSGGAGVSGTTLLLTTSAQTGATSYTVTISSGVVQDAATNTLTGGNTATFTGASTAVTVSSATATNNTTVNVVFNQSVTASTAECNTVLVPGACSTVGNWSIAGLTVTKAQMVAAGTNGTTVVLTTSSQTSSTPNGYTATATNNMISDSATGTVFCQTGSNTATFTGDVLPTVVSAVSVNATTVDVTFSEAVQWDSLANGALLNTNYSISPSLGTITAAAQTVATVVRLTTSTSQTASTSYTVTVSNVKDSTGNTISGSNTATFVGLEEIKILSATKVTDSSSSYAVWSVTFSKAFKADGGNNAANNLSNWNFPSGLNTVTLCTNAQDSACVNIVAGTSTTIYFKSTPEPAQGAYTIVAATSVGAPSGALGCIVSSSGTSPGNCLQSNPNDRATVNFGLPSDIEAGPVYTDPFNDGVTLSGQVLIYNNKLIIGPNNYDSGLFQTDLSLLNSSTLSVDADSLTAGNQPFAERTLTGTISGTTGTSTIAGTGTAFLTEVKVGQYLNINNGAQNRRVSAVGSDTSLTLASNLSATVTNVAGKVGMFETCSAGTWPNCTAATDAFMGGVDSLYAGCLDTTAPYAASTLTGSACTSGGGTEYLFVLGYKLDAAIGYQTGWYSTNTTSPITFTRMAGMSNSGTRTFRSMSVVVYKGWVYQATQHMNGNMAVRWNQYQPGGTNTDLAGTYLNKLGGQSTVKNGQQGTGSTNYLISIDTMYEHDNDGAGSNDSQLYIANGGSCGTNGASNTSCLGNTRTNTTWSDGGVLRNVLSSGAYVQPTACTSAANCDTKWEDVTPTAAKWLNYVSKALPQDASGDGVCGSPFVGSGIFGTDDWDCLVPSNTIIPAIKAIPKMVTFNGDLYMIRNACSSQTVQTLTASQKSTCAAGTEIPQLWRLNANAGSTAALARAAWTLVAENGSTGRTDMTGVEWLGGTGQAAKTANNREITMLLVNGNRLYIGFDNPVNGANTWRTKSGVTRASSEADFEAVCETGHSCMTSALQFGWGYAVTKIFDALSVNDAGTDYVIITGRTGLVPMQIYRQSNN